MARRRKQRCATSASRSETMPMGENAIVETTMSEQVKADGEGRPIHGGEEKLKDNQEGVCIEEELGTKPKKKIDDERRKRKNARNNKRNRIKKAMLGGIESSNTRHVKKLKAPVREKDSKKIESMGLIFMCNTQTKKDCFHYKVLGLPANKKETVAKVYKGMRLFLFDVDLRLMYGIYKATEPGGYNIEPKAFNSGFPSQVHFAIVHDCLPLPEEEFKTAIKDNYYGKNKFDCVLRSDQVKNLCKLFRAGSNPKPGGRVSRKEAPRIGERERERRAWDRVKHPSRSDTYERPISPRNPDTYERPIYASPRHPDIYERPIYASSRRPDVHERPIYASPGHPEIYERTVFASPRHPDIYERPIYASSAPPLPPPYAYAGRPVGMDYYAAKLELPESRLMELEAKPKDDVERRVPYALHQGPAPYRDPLQPAVLPPGYLHPFYRH